jgi:dipeptidyl aminopeptidase/acylaminoacyl peptidase
MSSRFRSLSLTALLTGALLASGAACAAQAGFTLEQALSYPYATGMVAAEHADTIAWVVNLRGVRNIWAASGPGFAPRQVTHYTEDDGQELTQLTLSPDASQLVYVRGGDHDANWPAEGGLAPDPASAADQPKVTLWTVALNGSAAGQPVKIDEGDAPALSARGALAYVKDHQVWTASLDGKAKPERLFFDRGRDGELTWSPDGSRLAFVSDRKDHAFIGVFSARDRPLTYLAASTFKDTSPRWSPDGNRIVFVRIQGDGGAPEPILSETPQPWSIWVVDAAGGDGQAVWRSAKTLEGSFPDVEGEANLSWAAGDRLIFLSEQDGWPHLYSISAKGGEPIRLTAGAYQVEHVTLTRDRSAIVYDANTGGTPGDEDRRHLFRVPVDRAQPSSITSGDTIEWYPVAAGQDRVAFMSTGVHQPPTAAVIGLDGEQRHDLDIGAPPAGLPVDQFVTPKPVTFTAADGLVVHGQLFQRPGGAAKPGVIFVHGGPPRQMLLGWHYMDYYSNAYAVNQYLAAHGYVVLSVNYRLGVGYGRAYQHPAHAGPLGAAEYQDVVAGARFLRKTAGVDPSRIGIWGGSYGGYLTGLALARNSDIFKAGVDLHGVHDWSRLLAQELGSPDVRYERGDRDEAMAMAFKSSPDADVSTWTSPVLLIQGDDDRNVPFQQTVDLARRLEAQNTPFAELVLPNEIHGFLRHESWVRADKATVQFLNEKLGVAGK